MVPRSKFSALSVARHCATCPGAHPIVAFRLNGSTCCTPIAHSSDGSHAESSLLIGFQELSFGAERLLAPVRPSR
jgi:hypothetical protein